MLTLDSGNFLVLPHHIIHAWYATWLSGAPSKLWAGQGDGKIRNSVAEDSAVLISPTLLSGFWNVVQILTALMSRIEYSTEKKINYWSFFRIQFQKENNIAFSKKWGNIYLWERFFAGEKKQNDLVWQKCKQIIILKNWPFYTNSFI